MDEKQILEDILVAEVLILAAAIDAKEATPFNTCVWQAVQSIRTEREGILRQLNSP